MPGLSRAEIKVEQVRQSGLGRFLAKYSHDRADDHAILIAFSALFSLFPLLGALLTLLGFVVSDPQTLERLADTISQQFPNQVGDLVAFLRETRSISGLLGVVSLIGLLWSASAIFGSMEMAFNHFYGLRERGFIGQRVMAFWMIFVCLGLALVSTLASSAATLLLGFSTAGSPVPLPELGFLPTLLGWGVSLLSAWLLFLAVYWVVPNARMSLSHVWRGALLAAALFLVLNQLFPIYLGFFGGGFTAYKTLGLFLLLMTWFYFLARILVLGCELNAFLRPLPTEARLALTSTPTAAEQPRRSSFARLGRRALGLAALLLAALLVARPRRPV